jgi:hypothetical protein
MLLPLMCPRKLCQGSRNLKGRQWDEEDPVHGSADYVGILNRNEAGLKTAVRLRRAWDLRGGVLCMEGEEQWDESGRCAATEAVGGEER